MAPWVGLLPPLLAVLYAGWCGNLLGGATASGSSVAMAVVLAMLAFAGPQLDALRLGLWGRAWPAALCCAVAASAWLSPVPRAALGAVALLPAYLFLPGSLARFWTDEPARRLGARGLAAAVAGLAAWSLAAAPELAAGGAPPAPLPAAAAGGAGTIAPFAPLAPGAVVAALAPLGHHTLLAVWIATLLPLGLLVCRERTAWRWLGLTAGLAGAAAIVAGRSLAGGVALAGEALLAAVWLARRGRGTAPGRPLAGRPARRLAAGLLLLALALVVAQTPRLLRVAGWNDPSAQARWIYLRAAWEGWRERPWLGWGPGSVAWTDAWFLAPRPGLNPWGEAVGELHSLPAHLAYEIGSLGLLGTLGTAALFARRRWSERCAASDPLWLAAGGLGLAGAALAWLATAALAVPALPWALAAAAAAALAGGVSPIRPGAPRRLPSPAERTPNRRAFRERLEGGSRSPFSPHPLLWVYGLAAAAALVAPQMARWHYDRAVGAGQSGRRVEAVAELAAAIRLDPSFPLYRSRLALLAGSGAGTSRPGVPAGRQREAPPAGAVLALQAARDARGIGLLWLAAGILGQASGEMWSAAALEQACVQDPLGPYAPFYLMVLRPDGPAARRFGARALLAEPRLAAATFWEGREGLFREVLEEVRRWPGVDAGWKLALVQAAPPPAARHGAVRHLGLAIDTAGFTQSTSLHLFRRLPWPALWPLVAVREEIVPALGMPPATALPGTLGTPFETGHCDPGN
jgi:O-antigen ligase